MSRSMPHSAWLLSIVLVSLASTGAANAATQTVTLKNGKTYEVEIDKRGEPVGAENRQVESTFLGTVSRASASSDSPAYAWMWMARLKKSGAYKVSVTTPIDETVSASFEVAGRGEIDAQIFFDSEKYPTLWTWHDEPETSWIPMVFTFEDTQSDNTFVLTQWTRFDAPDKEAFVRAAYLAAGLTLPEQTSDPSTEPTQTDTALVYIFRESNMRFSGKLEVYIDETPIALLPRLSYTSAITEPGWHLVWGEVGWGWFEFQGGQTYLLRILPGQAGNDNVLALDDPDGVQQGISALNLQHVELTEESLAKLSEKLDKYARAQKRAGDHPENVSGGELTNIKYKNERPGGFASLLSGFAKGTLRVSETAISYQSKDQELEIPMADILNAGLYNAGNEPWLAIRYREQDSIREAYFGAIHRLGIYNRMMLAIQHSTSTTTAGEP